MKENSFTLKNARSRLYSTETISDADYVDDLILLTDTPDQTQSQPKLEALASTWTPTKQNVLHKVEPLFIRIFEMRLHDLYYSEYSDYCPHFYCYILNGLVDVPFGLL